jgi:hypothetical protein
MCERLAHANGPRSNRHSVYPERQGHEAEKRMEVGGVAVVAGGDATVLLEAPEAALDVIAQSVAADIEGTWLLAGPRWDHGDGAGGLNRCHQRSAVIATIGQYERRLEAGQQCGRLRDVVALSAGQHAPQWTTASIHRQMVLGGQSASGAPHSRFVAPFLPVTAWAWARTIGLSIIRYSLSQSVARAANTRSQTPFAAQRVKRLCTLL